MKDKGYLVKRLKYVIKCQKNEVSRAKSINENKIWRKLSKKVFATNGACVAKFFTENSKMSRRSCSRCETGIWLGTRTLHLQILHNLKKLEKKDFTHEISEYWGSKEVVKRVTKRHSAILRRVAWIPHPCNRVLRLLVLLSIFWIQIMNSSINESVIVFSLWLLAKHLSALFWLCKVAVYLMIRVYWC